jgi:hypothetical protein
MSNRSKERPPAPGEDNGGLVTSIMEYRVEGTKLAAYHVLGDFPARRVGSIEIGFLGKDWRASLHVYETAMYEIMEAAIKEAYGASIVSSLSPEEMRKEREQREGGGA